MATNLDVRLFLVYNKLNNINIIDTNKINYLNNVKPLRNGAIDNYELDLYAKSGLDIKLNKQSFDLDNFLQIKSDNTLSFDIPKTQNNLNAFNNLGELQTSFGYYNTDNFPCYLLVDNVIYLYGILTILSSTSKEYSCYITGASKPVSELISDKSLNQLNMKPLVYAGLRGVNRQKWTTPNVIGNVPGVSNDNLVSQEVTLHEIWETQEKDNRFVHNHPLIAYGNFPVQENISLDGAITFGANKSIIWFGNDTIPPNAFLLKPGMGIRGGPLQFGTKIVNITIDLVVNGTVFLNIDRPANTAFSASPTTLVANYLHPEDHNLFIGDVGGVRLGNLIQMDDYINFDWSYFYMCPYVKSVIKQIFLDINYTVNGTFMDDTATNDLIIPFTKETDKYTEIKYLPDNQKIEYQNGIWGNYLTEELKFFNSKDTIRYLPPNAIYPPRIIKTNVDVPGYRGPYSILIYNLTKVSQYYTIGSLIPFKDLTTSFTGFDYGFDPLLLTKPEQSNIPAYYSKTTFKNNKKSNRFLKVRIGFTPVNPTPANPLYPPPIIPLDSAFGAPINSVNPAPNTWFGNANNAFIVFTIRASIDDDIINNSYSHSAVEDILDAVAAGTIGLPNANSIRDMIPSGYFNDFNEVISAQLFFMYTGTSVQFEIRSTNCPVGQNYIILDGPDDTNVAFLDPLNPLNRYRPLEANEHIYLFIATRANKPFWTGNIDYQWNAIEDPRFPDNRKTNPAHFLPEMKQIDFLKMVINQFNLQLDVDNIKRNININLFTNKYLDIYNKSDTLSQQINYLYDPISAFDLTENANEDDRTESPMDFYKTINFLYTDDNDYYVRPSNAYKYLRKSLSRLYTNTLSIESGFSQTNNKIYNFFQQNWTISIPSLGEFSDYSIPMGQANSYTTKFNIRIMKWLGMGLFNESPIDPVTNTHGALIINGINFRHLYNPTTQQYNVNSIFGVPISYPFIPLAKMDFNTYQTTSSPKGLRLVKYVNLLAPTIFESEYIPPFTFNYNPQPNKVYNVNLTAYKVPSLYQKFWEDYIDYLERSNKVDIDIYLSNKDWLDINVRRPIKIHNNIYYINKITGFNPTKNGLTKCTLIKTIK